MTAAQPALEAAWTFARAAQAAVHSGQVDRGISMYRAAVELCPDYVPALNNLALALTCTGYAAEAVSLYKRASDLQPAIPELAGCYLTSTLYAWGDSDDSSKAHLEMGSRLNKPRRKRPRRRRSDRRINIGYVSGTFCGSAEAFFLLPVFRNHDRTRFRIVCYSDVTEPDEQTTTFRALADEWRDIGQLGNIQVAKQVLEDDIDLLIDISGHFNPARIGLFTHNTGAVHVSYPSYPCTTGLPTMDARIGSQATDPAGSEMLMSEQLFRLDDALVCYEPPDRCPKVARPPHLARGYVTFGSFNRLHKVSDSVLEMWTEILERTPGSRMLFHNAYPVKAKLPSCVRKRIARVMEAHGVDSRRLSFVGQRPLYDHLRVFGRVDISLDTYPYNGMTTTCESLWMGVPVVTLAGSFQVSRVGLALLKTAGLSDCVAATRKAYIDAAVALARDSSRLAELRRKLRARFAISPFNCGAAYTKKLEDLYLAALTSVRPEISPRSKNANAR